MSMPSPVEMIVVLMILTLLFGAKRLPDLGAGIGRAIRNFKDSISGKDEPKEISRNEDANDKKD